MQAIEDLTIREFCFITRNMEVGSSDLESEAKNHENWHLFDILGLFLRYGMTFVAPGVMFKAGRHKD